MKKFVLPSAAILLLTAGTSAALGSSFPFSFAGTGVSGSIVVTYGSTTDTKVPSGYAVTGVSGTFTDTNLGLINAKISGVQPINPAAPEPTNLLAPADFSHFAVANGLPPESHGQLSYDDLFYPDGESPQTATDYPFHGGFFDIYGMLFDLKGSKDVVNLWSNGIEPGDTAPNYGVAVVNHQEALDYVNGVAPTPEPGSWVLLATGLGGMVWQRRRRAA